MTWSDAIELGEWLPDQPHLSAPSLRTARNVLPRGRGYDPWPTAESAGRGSLEDFCRGAASGRTRQGTEFVVAGTTAKLWLATSGALTDETWTTAPYTTGKRWDFALFADDLIAVNYDDAPQRYVLGTSTEFAAVHADAPRAKHCAVVREFLVFANLVGRGVHAAIYGTREDGVHWGGQGLTNSWPQTGTSAARAVLSDWQPIVDSGGQITDLVGGAEFGVVMKERSLWRMDWQGDGFRFFQIDGERGCYVPGSSIRGGGRIFFLSEDGVRATDGQSPSVPVGNERVDRWLHDTINHTRLERVAAFTHPTLPIIGWAFMSITATGNTMDKGLLYNWAANRFAEFNLGAEWVVASIQAGASLDAAPYATGNLDTTYGATDLDTITGGVERKLSLFNAQHRLDTLTGAPGIGYIETHDFELAPGRIAFVRSVRPHYKTRGSASILSLQGRMRSGDAVFSAGIAIENVLGEYETRLSARYHSAFLTLNGAFEEVHALSADFVAEGLQ